MGAGRMAKQQGPPRLGRACVSLPGMHPCSASILPKRCPPRAPLHPCPTGRRATAQGRRGQPAGARSSARGAGAGGHQLPVRQGGQDTERGAAQAQAGAEEESQVGTTRDPRRWGAGFLASCFQCYAWCSSCVCCCLGVAPRVLHRMHASTPQVPGRRADGQAGRRRQGQAAADAGLPRRSRLERCLQHGACIRASRGAGGLNGGHPLPAGGA